MTQPNPPRDTEWLHDTERHNAAQLLPDLIALCEARGHTPNALTTERIRHIILTDATASHLEDRLAGMLARPSERIPGAFANAVTLARQLHLRALEAFDAAYPQPAPEPVQQLAPGLATSLGRVCTDVYRERVNEVMERMAPELDPDEDPVVTTYFMEQDSGRQFHYELPKEAYTNIIRKPQIGDPVHPITREPMIPMQYRERQAKWDEIRRQKAEAKAKEEAQAQATEDASNQAEPQAQATEDLPNQTEPQAEPAPQQEAPASTTPQDPSDPPDPSDPSHSSHSPGPSPPPIGVNRCAPVAPKPCEGGSVANNPLPDATIPIKILPFDMEGFR